MERKTGRTVRGRHAAGFSLIEVNMAIFVIAVGILAMAALYPLGLRESMLGTADLKQSSLADYFLNQVVAVVSMTNFPYSEFNKIPEAGPKEPDNPGSGLPGWVRERMRDEKGGEGGSFSENDKKFKIVCRRLRPSDHRLQSRRRLGVWVRCTDLENLNGYGDYSRNPVYYAEAYFMGDPEK